MTLNRVEQYFDILKALHFTMCLKRNYWKKFKINYFFVYSSKKKIIIIYLLEKIKRIIRESWVFFSNSYFDIELKNKLFNFLTIIRRWIALQRRLNGIVFTSKVIRILDINPSGPHGANAGSLYQRKTPDVFRINPVIFTKTGNIR